MGARYVGRETVGSRTVTYRPGRLVSTVVGLVLTVVGCANNNAPERATRAATYDQTWAQRYQDTTCGEWGQQMTPDQQRVAAADMLVSARSVDGGQSMPATRVVAQFRGDIDEACSAGVDLPITEAAVGVYLLDKETYAP